jgi:hypothetical protein
MKTIALVIATGGLLAAAHAHAACTPAEMQKAQKAADNVVTWQHLYKAWKDHRQCDTGEVADTFTESVLRLMIEWKNVDVLAEGMKDPEYASFIQAHLQSPAAANDVKDVRSRATQSCPKGQDPLCKRIAAAAEGAKPVDLSPMAPLVPAGAAPTK